MTNINALHVSAPSCHPQGFIKFCRCVFIVDDSLCVLCVWEFYLILAFPIPIIKKHQPKMHLIINVHTVVPRREN
jgi:hypothetical protein